MYSFAEFEHHLFTELVISRYHSRLYFFTTGDDEIKIGTPYMTCLTVVCGSSQVSSVLSNLPEDVRAAACPAVAAASPERDAQAAAAATTSTATGGARDGRSSAKSEHDEFMTLFSNLHLTKIVVALKI